MDAKMAREIRYARLLCRYGRGFCVLFGVLFALGALLLVGVVFGIGAPGMGIDVGNYVLRGEALTPPASRAWALFVIVTLFAVLIAGTRFMFKLFDNLHRGDIFTAANVRLLRNLAWVAMMGAALQTMVPLISQLLVSLDVLQIQQLPTRDAQSIGLHLVPGSFITALLLWLASWIMDVGRRTRDEAEALRRDADLVI